VHLQTPPSVAQYFHLVELSLLPNLIVPGGLLNFSILKLISGFSLSI